MSTFKELAEKAERINGQLYDFSKLAFKKALAAGVVLEEQRRDDGLYIYLPVRRNYTFSGYEVDSHGIEIKGLTYTGGGEYDYTHICIPFDALDNLDAWIEAKKAEIAFAAKERADMRAAKEAREVLEQEQAERAYFQTLMEKYEGQRSYRKVKNSP
jgi:ABC-type lipoprotein release transport system permease subunit